MAKKSSTPKTKTHNRSAKTGKYVSESYAKRHPNTTVKEKDKKVRTTD